MAIFSAFYVVDIAQYGLKGQSNQFTENIRLCKSNIKYICDVFVNSKDIFKEFILKKF
jgi:hypothetical protein